MKDIHKNRKSRKFIILVLVVLGVITLGVSVLLAIRNTSSVKAGRSIFYVVSGGVGGPCLYYVSDSAGDRKDECVDYKSLETLGLNNQIDDLYDGSGTPMVLRLDADITIKKEQRSGTTPTPQYTTKQMIYLNKVYSSKKLPISQP